jgi:hypothetical protein
MRVEIRCLTLPTRTLPMIDAGHRASVVVAVLNTWGNGSHLSGVDPDIQIIQVLFTRKNISFERIDGDISDPSERQVIVNRFNVDSTIQVCLITTGVGAYGLTLTGADRVVIMDPSWNPGEAITKSWQRH